jgi:ribonucleoside-diphosphate reductase alpha chain
MNDMRMNEMDDISQHIWDLKYRLKGAGVTGDETIADTWARVAGAVALAERPELRAHWRDQFLAMLQDFRFLPAGRILAGAGSGRAVTLFNCFVMGTIPDDMAGIFESLKEASLTMQQGGGIGHDFSSPATEGCRGQARGRGCMGPVSFMDVWDAMCRTIMSAGARRGAMMATLRCDHPDIETFIEAKREKDRLRNFNLSVLVTDRFMEAVRHDEPWDLVFDGKVYRTVSARGLWVESWHQPMPMRNLASSSSTGSTRANNLWYAEIDRGDEPVRGEPPLPTARAFWVR